MDAPIGSWWHVWHELIGDAIVLHVQGEIDLATAPKFGQVLSGLSHAGPVVIDLSQVDYLDLAGVRALEDFFARMGPADDPFIVVGPRPHVRRVLDLVGLGRRLRMVETLLQALELLHITPPDRPD